MENPSQIPAWDGVILSASSMKLPRESNYLNQTFNICKKAAFPSNDGKAVFVL